MSLRSKVEHLEEWTENHRRRGITPVQRISDDELTSIICDDYGIEPGELTDEMLENISNA